MAKRTRIPLRKKPDKWVVDAADRAENKLNGHHSEDAWPETAGYKELPSGRYQRPYTRHEGSHRPGRPKMLTDTNQTRKDIQGLGKIQATLPEIAAVLGCSLQTLKRFMRDNPEIRELWYSAQYEGKASLRRRQFELAENSVPMSTWLGKQYLGQAEKVQQTGPDGGPLTTMQVDPAQLAKLTPEQRQSLQTALKLLMPDRFADLDLQALQADEAEVVDLKKGIEYHPDD